MILSYLVKTTHTSDEIYQELSMFGQVDILSKIWPIYLLETKPNFIPMIKELSFVVRIEENLEGTLSKMLS